jgi:GNAT superfamily N-acetyltransferase
VVKQHFFTSADFPESLKCQTLSFLRVQWPGGFIGENRLRNWVTKEADHPIHLVLVEEDILISHTNVVWKYLDHEGIRYKAYGLTGVFTYPAFRREGFGSRIIAAGTDYISQSDADIAMLYCDHSLRNFYAQHGWIHIDRSISYIDSADGPVLVDDEILMMQFISDKGQQGRISFECQPIYFGSDSTW